MTLTSSQFDAYLMLSRPRADVVADDDGGGGTKPTCKCR